MKYTLLLIIALTGCTHPPQITDEQNRMAENACEGYGGLRFIHSVTVTDKRTTLDIECVDVNKIIGF